MLDIEVARGDCAGAKIVVYFAPIPTPGFLWIAINAAV